MITYKNIVDVNLNNVETEVDVKENDEFVPRIKTISKNKVNYFLQTKLK